MKTTSILSLGTIGSMMVSAAEGAPYYSATGFTVSDSESHAYNWNIDATGSNELMINFSGSSNMQFGAFANNFGLKTYYKGPGYARGLEAVSPFAIIGPSMIFGHNTFHLFSNGNLNAVGFSGSHGYMAFTFSESGTAYYGWAFVTLGNNSFTVNSWACSTSPIAAGDTNVSGVPEPAETSVGLGALALGAAGLLRMRRRKAARQA
jgi:MYXO-CTERM domain-containing protein